MNIISDSFINLSFEIQFNSLGLGYTYSSETLKELYLAIKKSLASRGIYETVEPTYRDFRVGDVRHSQADINKAKEGLGYNPEFTILEGIDKVMPWYIDLLT